MLATGMDARNHLDTAGSSMNGNTAVMLEAALSSAVMHQNVVQTYDYQTRSSSLSGGQVSFCTEVASMCRLCGKRAQKLFAEAQPQTWVAMSMQHSITVQFFREPLAHCKESCEHHIIRCLDSGISCNWLHMSDSLCSVSSTPQGVF